MSAFKNPNFVNEFAYRTKLNYFYQIERFSEDKGRKLYARNEINRILNEMSERGFAVEEYYEITDLINSLIGLLIFPEQACFKYITDKKEDTESLFPQLYKCIIRGDFKNTYCYNGRKERNSPKRIIKHIKNALSHQRVMITPRYGRINGDNVITAITFEDEYVDEDTKDKYEFSLTIDVCDLENVVMEICDYLIKLR